MRLNIEALEDRTVPSTASLKNGILSVLGDNGNNQLTVRLQAADPTTVEVVLDGYITNTFKTAQVTSVVMDGGKGDDIVTNLTGITSVLQGGDGDDNLWSFGNDVLLGGKGNDVIYAIVGTSFVDGGQGKDRIITNVLSTYVPDTKDFSPVVFGQVTQGFQLVGGVVYFAGSNGNDVATIVPQGNKLLVTYSYTNAAGAPAFQSQVFNKKDVSYFAGVFGAGNDVVTNLSDVDDVFYGAAGNDVLTGGTGKFSLLKGGADNDTITARASYSDISGDPGADVLIGAGKGNQTTFRADAADTILWRQAVDIVLGLEKMKSSKPICPAVVRTWG